MKMTELTNCPHEIAMLGINSPSGVTSIVYTIIHVGPMSQNT